MVLSGVRNLEFNHQCIGPEGNWYSVRTHKSSLLEYQDGVFEILGISRLISYERSIVEPNSVENHYVMFSNLDDRDRRICQLIGEGHSSREIATTLDVSSKTIENRRKLILLKFEFANPIEIAKLLVRFEERGMKIGQST